VLDLFSCQVGGWSMQARIQSALERDALRLAWFRRSPQAGLIAHSDRRKQYCSHEFQKAFASYGIRGSIRAPRKTLIMSDFGKILVS